MLAGECDAAKLDAPSATSQTNATAAPGNTMAATSAAWLSQHDPPPHSHVLGSAGGPVSAMRARRLGCPLRHAGSHDKRGEFATRRGTREHRHGVCLLLCDALDRVGRQDDAALFQYDHAGAQKWFRMCHAGATRRHNCNKAPRIERDRATLPRHGQARRGDHARKLPTSLSLTTSLRSDELPFLGSVEALLLRSGLHHQSAPRGAAVNTDRRPSPETPRSGLDGCEHGATLDQAGASVLPGHGVFRGLLEAATRRQEGRHPYIPNAVTANLNAVTLMTVSLASVRIGSVSPDWTRLHGPYSRKARRRAVSFLRQHRAGWACHRVQS